MEAQTHRTRAQSVILSHCPVRMSSRHERKSSNHHSRCACLDGRSLHAIARQLVRPKSRSSYLTQKQANMHPRTETTRHVKCRTPACICRNAVSHRPPGFLNRGRAGFRRERPGSSEPALLSEAAQKPQRMKCMFRLGCARTRAQVIHAFEFCRSSRVRYQTLHTQRTSAR